jgi:formylglycine-generating enzyme required for sulfatase activity
LIIPGCAANNIATVADSAQDIDMVFVKGGCFQMGDTFGDGREDEKPVHQVCISDFYIGKYVVTQAQWVAVMGSNPSTFTGERRPVEQVSWDDAQDFIAKLNAHTLKRYRLPTEAEWEYAARSGGKHEKWAGTSDANLLGDYAWYNNNSGQRTQVVGQKQPNGLGLYDMSGNICEWVQDLYGDVYYEESPEDNPHGPMLSTNYRVLRGGCWHMSASGVRAAARTRFIPSARFSIYGFRLVLPAGQ